MGKTLTSDENREKIGQPQARSEARACQSVDWYSEGQTRIVDVDGVQITIRFVRRHGRRARIAISAPPGTVFRAVDVEADFTLRKCALALRTDPRIDNRFVLVWWASISKTKPPGIGIALD